MFKNTYQSGFVSILYAGGSKPLGIWGQTVQNGHIRRVTDEDVQTLALEIMGTNVATTYIKCPANPKMVLGIRLPFFVMIVKNMKKYFTFEVQILDDKNMSRRFRVSNYQSTTRVRPFSTSLPIGLTGGWNQIQFNLADFTRRAYGSSYLETLRVQIHANVRIRRIYFCDRLYNEEELPADYKLYVPISIQRKEKPKAKGAEVKVLVEEKGTGKDERRVSKISTKSDEKIALPIDTVPSGALPTPAEGSIAGEPVDESPTPTTTERFEEGSEALSPVSHEGENEGYENEEEEGEMSVSPDMDEQTAMMSKEGEESATATEVDVSESVAEGPPTEEVSGAEEPAPAE